jgi:hypothetical protein
MLVWPAPIFTRKDPAEPEIIRIWKSMSMELTAVLITLGRNVVS